jgi:hypothetical protein
VGEARAVIARKGPWFPINLLVFGVLAIWLALAIARWNGAIERPYQIVRVIALGYAVIFAYLSFVLERRGNTWLLLHFAAACVGGEIVLRAMGSLGAGVKNDRPWREPRPYFMFGGPTGGRSVNLLPAMDEGAGREIRLNAEGFRTREIVTPKPADELRIFFVGGSTVIGGYQVETTIPGVVEAHLHANGLPRARTYNFGVLSFVSGQELALLVHRLIDLKPDLVIAYDGGNDLYEPWVYDPRPGYPFNFVTEEEAMTALANAQGDAKTFAGLSRDSALLQALLGTSDWANRAAIRIDHLRSAVDYGSPHWKQAVVSAYARNLAAMCHFARGNGALFAAYFQPLLAYSKALDANQATAAGGDAMVPGLREQRDLTLRAMAAQFPAPPAEAGCRFGDLSGILENDAAAFTDAIHVDIKSNQLIGRRIAEDLLAWPALQAGASALPSKEMARRRSPERSARSCTDWRPP